MSATYSVRVENEGFEIYEVQADSESEAMSNWADGELVHSEVHSSHAVSAEEEDW